MKLLSTQLSYLLSEHRTRSNLKALLKYVAFLILVVIVYALIFHWIMVSVEKQYHSWLTGVYWTLTVMSTLGFGDITFTSDVGRFFSIVVLMSGIVLLLIVLPFAFIRFFYAPWLEAQLRSRAPREAPAGVRDHVIICRYETVARGLIEKLKLLDVPYFVIEPDASLAANLSEEGISVVTGEIDNSATYTALRAEEARMVLANADDATNTNITLTVRERAQTVPVVAVVEQEDSLDILKMAGATQVMPLKRTLGEHLANRVNTGRFNVHFIGTYKDMMIAEFAVGKTPLSGKTLRETRLRQATGVNVVGIWEKGRLLPARPDTVLTEYSVPIIMGTRDQITEIESFLVIYNTNDNPVVILGGGNVGYATARALREKGVSVHVVEKDISLLKRLKEVADEVINGNAADLEVIMRAGLADAPSVVITTNDDATNIYLCVYCRRLNPELRIVSRITHERNIEAIHRAGADFVLSYATLGSESVFSILQNRELVVLGEGLDLLMIRVPLSLAGKTLGESRIGSTTGLNVIAIQKGDSLLTNPPPHTILVGGSELIAIGNAEQQRHFHALFE
ncbi:MAG: NAD-binding protein [Syntrophaceae bacterium]|nr:NAD-binding protein [Syntrophaceae bacterium]